MRADLLVVTEFTKDTATYTLRDAIEWHKLVVRNRENLGILSAKDIEYIQSQWLVLTQSIAAREGVPQGAISMVVDELATSEIKLLETAKLEAETVIQETREMIGDSAKPDSV